MKSEGLPSPVIELAKHWDQKVTERKISIDEIIDAHAAGSLKEAFGSGTAAVISPVGEIKYGDKVITINDNQTGPIAQKLYDAITGIQYGKADDPLGWVVPVA
jgi:branched-chain amino acid aminotransferase